MHESQTQEHRKNRHWLRYASVFLVVSVVGGLIYVRMHPLVFNESLFQHAHCIAQVGMAFQMYANDHAGRFPAHTNGYGDALLLLLRDDPALSFALTGPGYDRLVFDCALTNHTDVPESQCGRVYIQGLAANCDPSIVLLFDKLPTPGGDHCHGLARLSAPLCREVALADGSHQTIREHDWPEFTRKQIELLVEEGFSREQAEAVYAEEPKRK